MFHKIIIIFVAPSNEIFRKMFLLNFTTAFPDAESCKSKRIVSCDKQGVVALHMAANFILTLLTVEYLQNYLKEYCCLFNRRYFGTRHFDKLLVSSETNKNKLRSYKI